jgi:tetratricopeptide (TPR) repeat protein
MELTINQALQQGIEAHKAGQVQEADRLYTTILKAQPKHPDANHNMGVLAVSFGKVQEALPFFETALEANPSTAQFWLSFIDALIKLDRLVEAKTILDQAQKNGAVGDGFDKLEQRLLQTAHAESITPQNSVLDAAIELRESGKFIQAIDLLKDEITKFPDDPNLRALLSHCYILSKDIKEAAIHLDKAKSLDPSSVLVGLNEARLLLKNKQVNDAIAVARSTNKRFPDDAEVMAVLGSCLRANNEIEESLTYLEKSIELIPNYAESLIHRGLIRLTKKDKASALVDLEKAHKLKPHIKQIWDLVIGLKVEAEQYSETILLLINMIEIEPKYEKSFANMALCHQNLGNNEAAIEAYTKALAIKPDYTIAYNNMGIALQELGKLEEAIEAYTKALAIKPDYPDAYNNMGNALKDQGKLEEAIEAYTKALATKPDYAEAYNNIGGTLREQGKLEEAIEAYTKALAIKPDYAEVKNNLAETLKIYSPKNNYHNPLIDLDNKIKAEHNKLALSKIDHELAIYTANLLNDLQSADKNLSNEYLQIYRRNNVDLNCKRHMQIFKDKEIIPKFCFSCYKVQVDVTTVLDLIRLAALFYESEFESDLTRKCLVEVRPNIPGSYKGLIYCRGLDQAHSVKKQLDVHVRDIDKNLVAKIKKGCSEFPIAFPEYGEIAASEEEMMQYPKAWRTLEVEFDVESPTPPKTYVNSSLKKFCLSDYLIIQKWIDYAKGISDPTSKLFCSLPIKYGEIWEIAKARLEQ